LTGRRVRTIVAGRRNAGTLDVSWDLRDDAGRGVAAGVYWIRARLGEHVLARPIAVLR